MTPTTAAATAASTGSNLTLSDPLIAALIAGAVAAIGVAINYWNTHRQLTHDQAKTRQQLEHDRQQKEAERALTLRRDIYLGLAAHLQDGLFAIGDLANPDREHNIILQEWRKNAHYAAKLHLMGGGQLVKAYSAASNRINLGVHSVAVLRRQINALIDKQKSVQSHIDQCAANGDEVIHIVRRASLAGTLTEAESNRLWPFAEAESDRRMELAKQADSLSAQIAEAARAAMRVAATHQGLLYPLLVAVSKAARDELRESFDTAAYAEILEAAAQQNAWLLSCLEPSESEPEEAPTLTESINKQTPR